MHDDEMDDGPTFCTSCGDLPLTWHPLDGDGLCVHCKNPDHYIETCPDCHGTEEWADLKLEADEPAEHCAVHDAPHKPGGLACELRAAEGLLA